ncbi:MAG: Gfo/Idh/MocA family oxidoreductase [Propionibacteriaceae bacterium]|jgi:predicted dehydrogenase|nr:Gfo/Idh/MocA family oxidoreductase [Propionibacteriaceae bacterium]
MMLNAAVIGYGWMGRLHAGGYRQLSWRYPELGVDVRLAVAADTAEPNREAAKVAGFERVVSDYREVLADPSIDVVSIALPSFSHREVALAAAAAGKPFWIEKPMGLNAGQSRDIAEAAVSAGLVTGVGFNYRRQPAIARARQIVRSGELGRITNARVWMLADYASSPGVAYTWRFSKDAGPGVVSDLLSHGTDLTHFLVGRISELSAQTGLFIPERPLPLGEGAGAWSTEVSSEKKAVENEDYVSVLGRTDSEVLVTLEASRVAIGPRAEYIVEVYGTEGSLRWNFERPMELQLIHSGERGYSTQLCAPGDGEYGRFQPGAGMQLSFDDPKTVEAADFIRSVLSGQQLVGSAADAWQAAEVSDAIVRSASSRAWEAVPEVSGPVTYDA